MHDVFPLRKIALLGFHVQVLQGQRVHILPRKHQRHFVNRSHVFGGDDGLFLDIAEQRNLRLDVLRQEAIRPAKQDVRLNSDAEQFFHRVLCGLGLQFLRRRNERHQRDMDEQRVFAT